MAEKMMQLQKDIKDKAEDLRDYLDDLKSWEADIMAKDATVAKKNKLEADYPPVRGTVDEAAVLKMQEEKQKEDPVAMQKQLGNEFFKKGKFTEAAKCYAKGVSLDEDHPDVHLLHGNRAMALLKLEKFADAEEAASAAVRKNRTFVKGFFRRAVARKEQGKLEGAIEDLNTALVIESDNKDARSLLAQLQAQVKAKEKAAKQPVRKKLAITEVDDDDEDEDEAVEIPVKRKPAASGDAAPSPKPAAEAPKVPKVSSAVEELSDDEEDVPVGKKPQPKQPAQQPAQQPKQQPAAQQQQQQQQQPAAAVHVDPAAGEAGPPAVKAASPTRAKAALKKTVLAPSDAAKKAAEAYRQKAAEEPPATPLHFERVWKSLKGRAKEEKAGYLRLIPLERYGDFFHSNVEEEILGDAVVVVHDVVAASPAADDARRAFRFLAQVAAISRLAALLLFLDPEVGEKLRALPARLQGREGVDPARLAAVAKQLQKQLEE